MGKKRPERTERRARDRAARQLIRDREKLAALSPGGSEDRPIEVESPAVIELRAGSMPCPVCDGELVVGDHQSAAPGLRVVSVACRVCRTPRQIWFRLGSSAPS
ncbi:MAG TPA: hypothetical protein VK698_36360 [Kofleriaceae bacterium]|nr:hypothetical protein [Kofleriaceae bacterium]